MHADVSDSGRVNRHAVSRTGSAALDAAPGDGSYSGDEEALRTDVIRLASRFGRYGYRQIHDHLLRIEGWEVNHKRVERIWRQEGLKVPRRQPKRGRLWRQQPWLVHPAQATAARITCGPGRLRKHEDP